MEFLQELLKENLGTVLTFVFLVLMWFKHSDQAVSFVEKLETYYDKFRKMAEEKKLYDMAKTAYKHVKEMSEKTEMTADDKIAEGLSWMIKAMKKAGLDKTEDTEDVIKGYFNAIHTAEKRAKELMGGLPLPGSSEETSS